MQKSKRKGQNDARGIEMPVDADELRALPLAEKLRLIEFLWDDLGDSIAPIPLPGWVDQEVAKRRDEMRDPTFGLSHDEVWTRVERRNG